MQNAQTLTCQVSCGTIGSTTRLPGVGARALSISYPASTGAGNVTWGTSFYLEGPVITAISYPYCSGSYPAVACLGISMFGSGAQVSNGGSYVNTQVQVTGRNFFPNVLDSGITVTLQYCNASSSIVSYATTCSLSPDGSPTVSAYTAGASIITGSNVPANILSGTSGRVSGH